jgi:hypothetical protein
LKPPAGLFIFPVPPPNGRLPFEPILEGKARFLRTIE